MFLTQPSLEQFMPAGFAPPSCKFWRGVSLSLETPWYICVVETGEENASETSLVAWESELLNFLDSHRNTRRLNAVGRMDKSRHTLGKWELRWISAIWESTFDEREEVGHFVLRFEGEDLQRDELLHEVSRNEARPLLFSAPLTT